MFAESTELQSTGLVSAIGFVAAFCTTVAYMPQVLHVIRLRSARELSYPMLLLLSFGLLMWLIYGIDVHSWPLIISNTVTSVLSLSILALKIYYAGKHRDSIKSKEQQ